MPNSPMTKVIEHLRRTVLLRDGGGVSDGQLLQRFIEDRDEAAFEALVRRHGPMVLGVCRRILGHAHDAEDAFQATFLVLVRKAAAVVPREAVGNWLYGVSYHTALKAKAASAKRGAKERQVKVMPEPEAVRQDFWEELQPLLDQELSRLPDKYRLPIVLCDLQGRTRKEVARQLRIPEGTLSSRLTTARRMLAQRLARRGVALSGGALAVVLSENAASACVPTSLVVSTAKAATLVAAGQAAATSVISAKVAALTEGVLKTMLLTKLKLATAVLFVATTVALICGVLAGQQLPMLPDNVKAKAQIKPAEPPKDDKDKLQGTWQLVSTESAGLRIGAGRPEIKDTRLVIEKTSFTLFSKLRHSPDVPLEPEDVKYVGAFTLDTKKNPKVIVLTFETNPWNDKKDFTQRGIYALDGDSLKLCQTLPNEDRKLPTEFSANYGSKRSLWTYKRDPPSEKGGKKQQSGLPDDVKAKPPSKPAEPPKEDKLQGTWRMVTAEVDGLRHGEGRPEIKDNRLVIEKPSFTFCYARNVRLNGNNLELVEAENATADGAFTLDTKQTPKVIVLTWKESPWNGKKDFTQKAIYAVDVDTLRLCLRLAEDDKQSPTEFSANAGSKRALWTFKRQPAPEKTADQKKPKDDTAKKPKAQGATERQDKEKQTAPKKDGQQNANAWFEQALLKAADENLKHAKKALQAAEMSYFQFAQIIYISEQLHGRASVNDKQFKKRAQEEMERAKVDLKRAERNLELAKQAQTKKKGER